VNKSVVFVLCCVWLFSNQSFADSLTAVELEEVITLSPGGPELRLKGAATKSNARQAIYVGGLYLQNDATSVNELLSNSGAKRFLIKTNQSVKPESIIRAINLGITVNHTEQELLLLEPAIKEFNRVWKNQVKEGDEVHVDFITSGDTQISVNGEIKGKIAGERFYQAFLKTWLGDKPLNQEIKKQLMGH
jgi:hypothetical protein